MDKQIFTTKEIPYSYYNYSAYRIEIDITDSHQAFQRHVWIMNDGTIEKDDEWINSSHNNKITDDELICRGYSRV